ncbi:MAG: ABC transporter ATP-binding protein [Gaiellaceae bacterium]
MQRLVARSWFRRRRVGLGWRPVSWQGWAISVVALALAIGVLLSLRSSPARIPIVILIFAVYAIVALLTGGAGAGTGSKPKPIVEEPQDRVHAEREPRRTAATRPTAPSHGPALVVEHLTKRFGDRVAVDDASFSVGAGEVFGFLGPNGAGKTTTVRMLATLIAPTSGSAVIAGIPLEPANGLEIRQRIAVMPESSGLYLRLTVAENLEFFAALFGLPRQQERIRQALEAVSLEHRANDSCGSLSKGLRQRVALARTLLSDPAIVFLDEPTSGLDPLATREVNELVDRLRNRGVTVFLTTHRLEEAERLCDRVAILNRSLRTIGRPDELRDRLFTKTLVVRTAAPLGAPEQVFAVAGVESWRPDGAGGYVLTVADPRAAAPQVTRALVAANADVLSLAETHHSLEDVYLELIGDDVEASR